MGRLTGKVAVITGAGRGIGRAACLLFAEEGARVVLLSRTASEGEAVRADIEAAGGEALFIRTDVSEEASVAAAIAEGARRFGGIDILYNNAGGSTPADNTVLDVAADEIRRSLAVDLMGTVWCCRAALPHIIAKGSGAIVNTTSLTAMIGVARLSAYSASKGAIISLTRQMAVDYAPHRIRVNAIAPSTTLTERVRAALRDRPNLGSLAGRNLLGPGEPEDIAHAALFLASDEGRHLTGHILPVDGGALAC